MRSCQIIIVKSLDKSHKGSESANHSLLSSITYLAEVTVDNLATRKHRMGRHHKASFRVEEDAAEH